MCTKTLQRYNETTAKNVETWKNNYKFRHFISNYFVSLQCRSRYGRWAPGFFLEHLRHPTLNY